LVLGSILLLHVIASFSGHPADAADCRYLRPTIEPNIDVNEFVVRVSRNGENRTTFKC
jgi:hypothetical protein